MKQGILYKSFVAGLLVTCANNALAANLTVSGPQTESIDVTYDSISYTGDYTLTVDSAASVLVNGNVTTSNGEGSINLIGDGKFAIASGGEIGSSSDYLKSITMDTSNDNYAYLEGTDAYIQKIDIKGGLFYQVGGSIDVTGTDIGAADITISGGRLGLEAVTVMLEDDISVTGASEINIFGTTTIDNGIKIENSVVGAKLNMDDTASLGATSIGSNADLSLNLDETVTTGSFTLDAGSTLNVDAENTATLGAIDGLTAGNGNVDFTTSFTLDNTIGATNKVASVEISGVGTTLTADATVNTDNINFDGDSSLIITNGNTVTTDNVTNADGEGSINVTAGSSFTVNGDIGTGASALKSLSTDASAVTIDKTTGNAYVQKLDINTGATFTSTGGTLDVKGGDAGTPDFTASGTINLTDTTVTLEDAISVDGTSAITLGGATTIDQGIKVEDTVAGSTLTISGSANSGAIALGNAADLSLVATGTATTGAVTLDAGSTLNVDADETVTLGAIDGLAASNGTVNFHTKSFTLDNTIGATNKVASVEISGAATTLTADATVNTDNINFDGDSSLIITNDNTTTTDNVTNAGDGQGSINVTAGSSFTVNGDIGTGASALKSLSTDASAATIDKTTGNAYVQKLDINTGATFTSTGGILDVKGGDVSTPDFTVSGTVNLADTTVNLEDAISVDGTSNVTLSGTTSVDNTLDIENAVINNALVMSDTASVTGINIGTTSTGNTLAISDTANTGTIAIGNGSDLTINGTGGTTGAVSLDATGTLNVNSVDALTLGAIDGLAASNGTVNFQQSFNLDNTIGATNKVGTVELTGGATVLTAGATIDADTINFAGDSGLVIGNNSVIGNLTTNVDGEGNLTFNGTGTLTGTIGATGKALNTVTYTAANTYNMATSMYSKNVALASGATVNLTADTSLLENTALTSTGASTLNLASHDLTTTGTANISGASILKADITSASDYGNLASTGTATVAADTVVDINVTGSLKDGDTYTIVDGTGGAGVATLAADATDNSNLFKFVQGASTEDLVYTSTADVAFDTDTAGTAIAGLGAGLQADIEGGNLSSGLFNAMDTLAGLTSAQQAAALQTMAPELNGAQVETTFDNQNKIYNTISRRTNVSEEGMWLDTSYSTKDKDAVDSIDGYDADTTSITVGADMKTTATSNLGLAFTYAQTDIEGKDTFKGNKNDVDSYNVTVYGAKEFANGAKVDAQATAGISQFDSSRDLSAIGAGTAKGDYDATTYGVNANLSKDYDFNGVSVAPVVGLAYNSASFDAYTETGSAAALNVEKETFESLRTKVGVEVELAKLSVNQAWTVKPEVRGYWNHELMDDNYNYTASLVGGNSSFTTNGAEPESDSYTVGAGVEFAHKAGWNVGVAYDADLTSDSTTHNAKLVLSKKF